MGWHEGMNDAPAPWIKEERSCVDVLISVAGTVVETDGAKMVIHKPREGGGELRYEPSMNGLADGIWVDEK